jgi:Uma2 family endonuclease
MKLTGDITYSVEEYFKIEETSDVKHEFYYGRLFEMPGEPIFHNLICLKIFAVLLN